MFFVSNLEDYQYTTAPLLDSVFLIHLPGLIPKGANLPRVYQVSRSQKADSLGKPNIALKNSLCSSMHKALKQNSPT